MKKPIVLPKFKTEEEETAFWDEFDFSEHLEPGDFKRVSFPNLKPSTRSISIRFPNWVINRLKEQANSVDVPYQSLIKQYVVQGLGL